MFKNWFTSSRGERLQPRSRPANTPKPHTSSRTTSVSAHHKVPHGLRRSTKSIVTNVTTKHPHTSIVVRRDGNVEVMTPRATVVLPGGQSNVSQANVVPSQSQSQSQHRSSTKPASRSTSNTTSSAQHNRQGHHESTQHPKRPQSSRSDRPARAESTPSRPSTSHRSGSYSREHDHGISPVQVAMTGRYPRRGSYPVVQLPATYAHGPSQANPKVIYQPIYSAPPSPAIAVHPAALYSTSAPRPRRSLSNADSVSSHYSDHANLPPYPVPRGWYNRRGDQYMRKGVVIMQPPGRQWHPAFASYPDVGKGWMNEEGKLLPQSGGILKGVNKVSVPSDIHIR